MFERWRTPVNLVTSRKRDKSKRKIIGIIEFMKLHEEKRDKNK